MNNLIKIYRQIRFGQRFYAALTALILLLVFSYSFPVLYEPAISFLYVFLLGLLVETFLLFRHETPLTGNRHAHYSKLSNGDENEVVLTIENFYSFPVNVSIIDELPFQLQERNFLITTWLKPAQQKSFSYKVRPVERGEYHFGKLNLVVGIRVTGFLLRHFTTAENFKMACYPSFLKLRQYELMAISNRLTELGIKKVRRIGHSTEFEQIKEYVTGDDVRTINWKATARRVSLMVNHYREERAQNVYSVVDMGRIMKMPFEKMTLLDYAINASLVIGHVAWIKQDKPGLICFSDKVNIHIGADRKGNQLLRLQEGLYNASTDFGESNYEKLLSHISTKITQRSLILLYTNFETLNGLKRQIRYLRRIAAKHLVVVVFFENTELKGLLGKPATDTLEIYEQTIAQKFDYEKRQISRELKQFGIMSVYTPPANLTVNSLNKYLEIKTRGLI